MSLPKEATQLRSDLERWLDRLFVSLEEAHEEAYSVKQGGDGLNIARSGKSDPTGRTAEAETPHGDAYRATIKTLEKVTDTVKARARVHEKDLGHMSNKAYDAIERYRAGESSHAIGRAMGKGSDWVLRTLRAYGIEPRKGPQRRAG